jgi:hypothetical protein
LSLLGGGDDDPPTGTSLAVSLGRLHPLTFWMVSSRTARSWSSRTWPSFWSDGKNMWSWMTPLPNIMEKSFRPALHMILNERLIALSMICPPPPSAVAAGATTATTIDLRDLFL